MTRIHPTAIVDPSAEIDETAEIGPYCMIGKNVRIGAGTVLLSHAHIRDHSIIGRENTIHMGAVIGHDPQFIGFDSSMVSRVVMGDGNVIREYVTIHRSIHKDGATHIGNKNFLMGLCHVAHDCTLGNNVIMANYAGLAGHVSIDDRTFVSGYAGIHQFVRVGTTAMISGLTRVGKDVPPYMILKGNSEVYGPNVVGLRRAGVSPSTRMALKRAYMILFRSGLTLPNGLVALAAEWQGKNMPPEVAHFFEFCSFKSKRGLSGPPRGRVEALDDAE